VVQEYKVSLHQVILQEINLLCPIMTMVSSATTATAMTITTVMAITTTMTTITAMAMTVSEMNERS